MVLQIHELPDIETIYPNLRADDRSARTADWLPYPACERPQDDDVALYMHSAGSTGLPKPIPITQRVLAQWTTHSTSSTVLINNTRFNFILAFFTSSREHNIRWAAMALPAFHTMGILIHVLMGLVTGTAVALYPPRSPAPPVVPSPQNIMEAARLCGCNGCMVVPSQIEVRCLSEYSTMISPHVLQIWAESDEALEFMKSLKILVCITYTQGYAA